MPTALGRAIRYATKMARLRRLLTNFNPELTLSITLKTFANTDAA